MRLPLLSAAFAALCLALPATAQKWSAFPLNGERAAASLAAFTEGFTSAAWVSITHGQPIWKDSHDAMLDSLKGKTSRLGLDWWTTLMTSVEIDFCGTKIPAGAYCVGVNIDKDGKFALVLIEAGKAMKANIHPFGPQAWTPDYTVPMTFSKGTAAKSVEKMTMSFTADEKEAGKGTFLLAWGKHTLTGPIAMTLPKK